MIANDLQLRCTGDSFWLICAELGWRSIQPLNHVEPPTQSTSWNNGPRLLGQLDLETTLNKQLPQHFRSSCLANVVNEHVLTDDAFKPKLYTVRIEKGDFMSPSSIGFSSKFEARFALRLMFDKSPYPSRSQWKNPDKGACCYPFSDFKEFVSRASPNVVHQRRAMNDKSTYLNSCVVS
jgi:hypothetical protein